MKNSNWFLKKTWNWRFKVDTNVVYFDQQTGTLHAVHWPKWSFQHFNIFSITNGKKEEKTQKEKKNTWKTVKVVYQHLGATLKTWLTPKWWSWRLLKTSFLKKLDHENWVSTTRSTILWKTYTKISPIWDIFRCN